MHLRRSSCVIKPSPGRLITSVGVDVWRPAAGEARGQKEKKKKSVKRLGVRLKGHSPRANELQENTPLDLFWIRPISYKTSVIPGGREGFKSPFFSRGPPRCNLVNITPHLWLCAADGPLQTPRAGCQEEQMQAGQRL